MTPDDYPGMHRLIVEQIADALIHSDTHGIIRGWNKAAEVLFGYPKDEAIGQSLDLIIPDRLRAAHWAGFDRAMTLGRTRHGGRATVTRATKRAQTGAEETIYVEMSFAVITGEDGKSLGSVAMARDVTQRHLGERQAKPSAASTNPESS